jgi:hypothetical protein
LSFGAVPFAGEAWHLIELTESAKAASLLAVTKDLESVPLEFGNGIQLLSGGGVQVDHVLALRARDYEWVPDSECYAKPEVSFNPPIGSRSLVATALDVTASNLLS